MSYRIEFDESLEIVAVIYSGAVSFDERIQAVEDVCKLFSAKLNPLRILVDVCELKMQLSINEQETFGKYLSSHPGLANARVAVLHPSTKNPNIIIDSAAYRNGYMLAQFDNRKDAEAWLRRK